MRGLRAWLVRLRGLFDRSRLERELAEELASHIELHVEDNIRAGMTPEEARRHALLKLGGVEQTKELYRDRRGVPALESFGQDLRFGLRMLMRNRGFAVAAVLTLGLGIGANAAVFSVVDAVFLRPLPYRDPDRLVAMMIDARTPGNFLDIREHNRTLEAMAAARPVDLNLTGDGEPERLPAAMMTANLLPLLGVEPALGRNFAPEEDAPGGPRAVIISHGLWQRRYGGDPGVLGRELVLQGIKFPVVGVMPEGFQTLELRADAWIPMRFRPEDRDVRRAYNLAPVGRLKPGVTPEQARADAMSVLQPYYDTLPPDAPRSPGVLVTPLAEWMRGDSGKSLVVLLVAVGLLLVIACINVGNLLLSRAAVRGRELAVRAALGAGLGRVMRQLVVENVPLVLLGTAVGLLFAYWSLDFLRQLIPPGMALAVEPAVDARVLGFALLVAGAATVLFGLAPAFHVLKVNLNEALRSGGARAGFSAGGRLQSALVVGEVGLAIALLVGASLLVQTFFSLRGQYAALRGEDVLTMKTVLPGVLYDTHAKREAFFEGVLERARAVPGVAAVGFTNALPLDYKGDATEFAVEGFPLEPGDDNEVNIRLVTADYLKALGVPLRGGRHFSAEDGPGALPVAVVNESMARRWRGQDPVGRRLKVGGPDEDSPWVTVVGVVADVRQNGIDEPVQPEVYFLYRQCDYMEVFVPKTLAIRAEGDHGAIVAALRREVAAVDPNQPVSDVRTLSEIVGRELSLRRLGTLLVAAFAVVALLLASIGIYGLLSQRVAQMTPEIGVRLALGAAPRDVVALVVGRGMKLVLAGAVAGIGLALAGTRLMESVLFGVSPGDPLTLVGVPLVLAAVALVACYVPARRAASVDPNVALRYE
jgi:putative ABC transport system permease protein